MPYFSPPSPDRTLCFLFSRDSQGMPPPGAGVIESSRPSTPKGPRTRRPLSGAFCLLRGRVPACLESLPNASRRDHLPPVCQQVAGALGTRFGLRGSGSPWLLWNDLWIAGPRQFWVVALVPRVCSAARSPGLWTDSEQFKVECVLPALLGRSAENFQIPLSKVSTELLSPCLSCEGRSTGFSV